MNKQKINLLFVLSQLGVGGLELQVLELIKGLDKTKFKIFVCPLWPIMELENSYYDAGANIVNIHKKSSLDTSIIFKLRNFLISNNIDIIHTWIFTANTWGRLAGIFARTPIIIGSERSVAIWKKPWHIFIDRFLAQLSDKVIANSYAVKQFLVINERINSNKCMVIYNGVDYEKYLHNTTDKQYFRKRLEIPINKFIIGTVANCTPAKDFPNFLEAARIVCNKLPSACFVVCGGGPLLEQIKYSAKKLDLQKSVIFLGQRRDIYNILPSFDVFLLTSRWEGFSNAILEAMAASLPVIATQVGGNEEAVISGETGFIVPPGDPKAISKRIIQLSNNKKLSTKMGVAGRDIVKKNFSLSTMISNYEKIYFELFNNLH